MARSHERPVAAARPPVVLGVVLVLLGAVLAAGGVFLMSRGQSPYFLVVGLCLILSGALLAMGFKAGLWVYLATLALIVVWSVIEEKSNLGALLPRVAFPLIIGLYLLTDKVKSSLR